MFSISSRSRIRPRWRRALSALTLLILPFLHATPVVAQSPPAAASDSLRGFGGGDVPVATPPAAAEPAPVARDRFVRAVYVTGNTTSDSVRIVRTFEVPPGSHYSPDAVRRGIKKLMALQVFDDVNVDHREQGDQVDLIIRVHERPHVTEIKFAGNHRRQTSDLEKKLFLHAGEPYSAVTVQTQIDTLLKYYRDEGFPRAQVAAVNDTVEHGIALTFNVVEGERVRITDIEIPGADQVAVEKLRKALKSRKKGFFGGGELKDESFQEDIEKLTQYYHNHGYKDAQVTSTELKPGPTPKEVTLVIHVTEGPRYTFGSVTWVGNTQVPTPVLNGLWRTSPGVTYDASRVQKAVGEAYGEYAEHGYLYVGIEPRETLDGRTVKLTFGITEGQPSHIRYVNIAGNKGTREKVIRREIAVHEGDRFRRSALVRTQGDLMRLGFFENVDIDFQPAESTDVDLTLKVKEKSVGTASAGAAYAGTTGITGFIDVGHNNVLGNGQSMAVHLERGANLSNYSLNFTEPWFHDTPTLLGSSVFNTRRSLDLYDEQRIGGSVRLGRPLRWPDYSRISVGYRLENVTIYSKSIALDSQDEAALSGTTLNVPTLTSSVNLDFQRNTTDNPFYSTHGTRLVWTNVFAGGPFGGSINYHEHRVDTRWYTHPVARRVVTMARARFGFVGEYADQHLEIPTYTRFRLGGGSTLDPLRGYNDYQVVPAENIYDTFRYDTLATGADSGKVITTRSRVRYPGGRWSTAFTLEQQFAIVHPLHGVIFFDAGNTWNYIRQWQPLTLRKSVGIGFRLEIPLLGNVGFDYAYGFDRDDGARFAGHFLLGPASF